MVNGHTQEHTSDFLSS